MFRISVLIAAVLLGLQTSPLFAASYVTQGGQYFEAGDRWVVVSRELIDRNQQEILAELNKISQTLSGRILSVLKRKGAIILLNREMDPDTFADNINLTFKPEIEIPDDMVKFRGELEANYTRVFKKPMQISKMKLTNVKRQPALYVEYSGLTEDTTIAQYHVRLTDGSGLIATLTARNSNFRTLKRELDKMTKSISRVNLI